MDQDELNDRWYQSLRDKKIPGRALFEPVDQFYRKIGLKVPPVIMWPPYIQWLYSTLLTAGLFGLLLAALGEYRPPIGSFLVSCLMFGVAMGSYACLLNIFTRKRHGLGTWKEFRIKIESERFDHNKKAE